MKLLQYFFKLIPSLILLSLSALLLFGCQTFSSKKYQPDSLRIFLKLEKPVYNPSEAVVAEVFLLSNSPDDLKINPLNYQTVTFWKRNPNFYNTSQLYPVYSEKEPTVAPLEFPSNDIWSRKFVFTQATETSGTFQLMATFRSDPGNALPISYQANSQDVTYKVEGTQQLNRDINGVLLKADAIKIAENYVNQPVKETKARLIINEAGFYDWFLLCTLQGKEVKRSVLINPYTGSVRKEVDPSLYPPDKQEKPTPRIIKRNQ